MTVKPGRRAWWVFGAQEPVPVQILRPFKVDGRRLRGNWVAKHLQCVSLKQSVVSTGYLYNSQALAERAAALQALCGFPFYE